MNFNLTALRALVTALLAALTSLAHGQNIIPVTTTSDLVIADAYTSLREAFNIANTDGQDSEIQLQAGSTYVLDLCGPSEDANGSGDLDDTEGNSLSLLGAGSTIQMQCAGERIIHKIDSPGAIALENVTLTGGDVAGNGAALFVEGDSVAFETVTVTLTNVVATNNSAGVGGVIGIGPSDAEKILTIINSDISNNTGDGVNGGFFTMTTLQNSVVSNNLLGNGIKGSDGTVVVMDSQVTGNEGTGVSNTGNGSSVQTVTVTNSQISGNTGNGVRCSECAGIQIVNGTIANNGETGVLFRNNPSGAFNLLISVEDSEISGNGATVPGSGGGITLENIDSGALRPTLQVTNTTIANNEAVKGGGIYVEEGEVTLMEVILQDNTAQYGGGVFIVEPIEFADEVSVVSIEDSTITNNTATGQGGGLALAYTQTAITNTLITNNVANIGGGLFADNLAEITLDQITFANNTGHNVGSGIANYEGIILLTGSVIHGGLGGGDAIDSPGGVLEIVNTTIAQNSGRGLHVIDFGSGLPAPTRVVNSTIVDNGQSGLIADGAGIAIELDPYDGPGGPHEISNTIIAGNNAAMQPDCNFGGALASQGHNLFGDANGCGPLQLSDLTGDPGLDVFSDDGTAGNGHYPLLAGSQAIDAAGACPPPTIDQLGVLRPQGGACDIGAIESLNPAFNVAISVTPGAKSNILVPSSKAGIWVAVLSDAKPKSLFDPVAQVNISSVTFGPAQTSAEQRKTRDINGDGIADLLLRFNIADAGFACGDNTATLRGQTFGGQAFSATDSIETLGCRIPHYLPRNKN